MDGATARLPAVSGGMPTRRRRLGRARRGGPLLRPLAKAGLASPPTVAGTTTGTRSPSPGAHVAAATTVSARQKSLASLLAGGTAGTLSATFTCPMEVVKTQLQSASRAVVSGSVAVPRRSALSVARSIAATQGAAGFFRGLPPTLIGILPARATYFWAYSTVKGALGPALGDSSLVHVASAVAAGVVSNTITNPIWLLKTRMQLQAGALAAAEAAAAGGAVQGATAAASVATTAVAATTTAAASTAAVASPVPVLASIASAAAGAPATMVGAGTVAAPAAVSAVPMLSVVKAVGGRGIAAGTAAAATGAAASVRSAATGAAGAAGAVGAAGVAVKPYTSYADGIRTIFRTEGIGGFYKGLTASYWGVTETALHFVVYEALKKRVAAHNIAKAAAGGRETESDKLGQLSSIQLLCSAATSKLLASVCTYPHEVIRTRLREQPLTVGGIPKYRSMIQSLRLIAREEGRAGLYAGMGPHLLRVVPNTALMFLVYESVMRSVDRMAARRHAVAVAADAKAAAAAIAARAAAAQGAAGAVTGRGGRLRGGRVASSRFFV